MKSFRDSGDIEIKPLTIFVGRNSCGKSSLVRFPVMIAQTFKNKVNTPLLLFGDMLDYGNYNDVVNKHIQGDMEFTLSFGREIKRYLLITERLLFLVNREKDVYGAFDTIEKMKLRVRVSKPDKKMLVKTIQLYVDGNLIFRMEYDDNKYYLQLSNLLEKNNKLYRATTDSSGIRFHGFVPLLDVRKIVMDFINKQNYSMKWKNQQAQLLDEIAYQFYNSEDRGKILKKKWYPIWESILIIKAIFDGINRYMDDYAEETTYVGPFRENPKRTYRDSENNYENVGVRGENAGMLLRQDWQNQKRLIKNVSKWFEESMGYEISIDDISENLYSLVVTSKLNDEEVEKDNLMDVGFGISQVLPIVTELMSEESMLDESERNQYRTKKNFVIEQPELHLHPAAQAGLADLLANAANLNRSRRIIVETHSEHLIRKLQVLIADPNVPIDNDQVAIYYVEKDERGESFIQKMEIAENGQFKKKWPSGFFDKGFELSRELMVANSKRK